MKSKKKRAPSPEEEGAILPKTPAVDEAPPAQAAHPDDEADELDPEDVITEVIERPVRGSAS